ncbi:MAG: hypothetical protein ACI9HY_001854, partial [Planctomycetaceae bacterium]
TANTWATKGWLKKVSRAVVSISSIQNKTVKKAVRRIPAIERIENV